MRSEQRKRCSKAKEKKRRYKGYAPLTPPPFEKGGRKLFCCLLPQSVHNGAAKLLNCPSLSPCASTGETFDQQSSQPFCPRKTPFIKVFARPFSKGRVSPRSTAYPSPRPRRTPRIPSSSVLFLCVELAGADLFAVVVYGDIG